MEEQPNDDKREQIRARLRQLILMRETGPKRAAWHAARARLIWRLHDELREASEEQEDPNEGQIKQSLRD